MVSEIVHKRRILIAPLDWGLGHATRCIPVIRALIQKDHRILIAAHGKPAKVLRDEFPDLECVPIVNYNITYAANPFLLYLKFPFLLVRVFVCAFIEFFQVRKIVEKYNIDTVISDNRFGCHTKKARSIYISHQLTVLMPPGFKFLEPLFWWGHRQAVKQFDELWIPDVPQEENLTGDLTRKFPIPHKSKFIGLLSRFDRHEMQKEKGENIDLLVMLSGPEPQRSRFERKVLTQLKDFRGKTVVLAGNLSGQAQMSSTDNVSIVSPTSSQEICQLLLSAQAIICRGGYTTIMELVSLNKKAVLVPTPGQTEQIYLCSRLESMGYCVTESQHNFDINKALSKLKQMNTPCTIIPHFDLLNSAIDNLIE